MILENLLLVVHVLVAATLVGFVLLQHGKGADMGAAFGSGASGSLFGASGSANFLSRTTAILAALFFMTSLGLTYYGSTHGTPKELMKESVTQSAPAPKDSKAGEVPQGATPPAAPAAAPAESGKSESKAGEVPK